MMVSTATAVFPVCLSPIMSSRWPRPIGTMESIALRPVCTGCETDFLQTTPGATFSITSVILAGTRPLPAHVRRQREILYLAADQLADLGWVQLLHACSWFVPTLSAPRPSLRACRAPSHRSLRRRR